MEQPDTTAFANWLDKVFDHPVHPVIAEKWYRDPEADTSEPAPSDCVVYLTRLFEEPEVVLASFTDAQIDQGLWYLLDPACSDHMRGVLYEPGVTWPQLQRCLRAMTALFERLLAPRCSDHLFGDKEASPLSLACFMWWENFPAGGWPANPAYAEIDAECLAVMKQVLALDSLACQESALHGLGHWHLSYPEVVEPAIDAYLARVGELPLKLREYAECARRGDVL